MNVLLVCDNQLRIRFVDATHPGACHDSFIWNVSDLRAKMEEDYLNNANNVWMLGDAGYPLEPWLLTPYRTPESRSVEEKFNEIPDRWRCLLSARELYYAPTKAVKIINVCVALHNICIHYKCDVQYSDCTADISEAIENVHSIGSNTSYLTRSQRVRKEIANSL